MIILYVIAVLIIILFIWLIIQRKWKSLLWTSGILLLLIIAGIYLFLQVFSEAFRAKCEENRIWKIEDYRIIEWRCIGFAGPYYYRVSLYKNNNEIDQTSFVPDSTCIINFNLEMDKTISFDICNNEIKHSL